MKNELKISTLSLVCVLCATAVSGAYGAASVRSLGGAGTYTSASNAASAGASGAMRGGSVRVTPTTGKTTATKAPSASATTGRVATTPRLSIGKYLPGGTSVSGGSSIKYPGGGGSSSSGGGSMDPGSAGLESDIKQLQQDVSDLQAADNKFADALDAKQDALTTADGYITIENNEVFLEVDAVKEAIGSTGGGEIELIKTDTAIEWCNSDGVCKELITLSELVGPAGPQGPAIDVDTMNAAIDAAINARDWSDFAKASDLAAYAKSADVNNALNAKANAGDVYTKTQSDGKYATKTDLAAKANAADVMTADQANATYATKKALADKQDKLTFDTTPTDGSTNPVTSGGVAQAIADAKISGEADLTNYATKQYVQEYVNIPTTAGSYMLTVNGDKKEWTEIKIVMPEGATGQ